MPTELLAASCWLLASGAIAPEGEDVYPIPFPVAAEDDWAT